MPNIIELSSSALNQTSKLQNAIDYLERHGGGRLRLLPGDHMSGSIRLCSHLVLELMPGANLKALGKPELFPAYSHSEHSRMDVYPWPAFIFGLQLENVTLEGGGTIDGGGLHPCIHGFLTNAKE